MKKKYLKPMIASMLAPSLLTMTMHSASFPIVSSQLEAQKVNAMQTTNCQSTKSVSDPDAYEDGSIIVVYKNKKSAKVNTTMKIANLNKKQAKTTTASSIAPEMVCMHCETEDALKTTLKNLENDSRIAYVQPNYTYHVASSSVDEINENFEKNPEYQNQWAYRNLGNLSFTEDIFNLTTNNFTKTVEIQAKEDIDIDLPEALANTTADGNRQTIVAIVDTGVMYDHEDLEGGMWKNPGEIADNGIDDDHDGYIDDVYGWNFYDGSNIYYNADSSLEDGHGTHSAGTIVARNNNEGIVGIAADANVQVMTLKALGGEYGSGCTEDIIKAIEYAAAHGANIINLSLGGPSEGDVIDQAFKKSIENHPDIMFTVAAGNEGNNNDLVKTFPACYDCSNIVSVANIHCDGTLDYSSNYGNSVDLAAPGEFILSTSTGNIYEDETGQATSYYEYMEGTSMSAPMVAGAAALLYAKYSTRSIQEIQYALLQSVKKLPTLQGRVATNGNLNIANAVALLEDPSFSMPAQPTVNPDTNFRSTAPTIGMNAPTTNNGTNPSTTPSTIMPVTTVKPMTTVKPETTLTPAPSSKLLTMSISTNKTWKKRRKVTFYIKTNQDDSIVNYQFILSRNGKVLKKKSGKSSKFTYNFKKKGSYTITAKAKNSSGLVALRIKTKLLR